MRREHLGDHARAAAGRHVHVDEHDVGRAFADHLDRGVDVRCRADDVDRVAELGAHAREEQLMVVDEEHAGRFMVRALRCFGRGERQLDLGAVARRATARRPGRRRASSGRRSSS